MRPGGFRFAVLMSLAFAALTGAVAVTYQLPLRDPDGVAVPTYVRLPAILLIAFLTDVVPRAAWRCRSPMSFPRQLVAVVRQRWPWEHTRFALVGLGAWYLTYAAFRNLKSFVPFVNRELEDAALAQFDRIVWLGRDPASVLHDLFGVGWAAHFFSLVYVAWIVLVPVTLVIALVWSRERVAGAWYVTAVAVDWVLGVATYFAVPTLGPVYAAPEDFAALPHTYVSSLQESMIADRYAVLADPFGTTAVQTIAAFASLHVGIMVTVCVMAELLVLHRWVRWSLWLFLALTVLATVYLGWHYFSDALGGAFLGVLGVWIAALGTGNHERGRPRLVAAGPASSTAGQDSGSRAARSRAASSAASPGS
ncbi:MAG TPA: phosphatase PAP2 family protein [Nocardioidaceae bacterium]|nr:phosphatase PAP2 family protein [Nocardioidaceae bacterium]